MNNVNRYFIALIPPEPLLGEATRLKQFFSQQYQSKAALHSPPHITLHMPFEMKDSKEHLLVDGLSGFGRTFEPFEVNFNGFGCFAPRVIFIHVDLSETLTSFERSLTRFCKTAFQLFNARYQDQPFHPHLTVAFRDLKKAAFERAWGEVKDRALQHTVRFNSFHLLRHDGSNWHSIAELPMARQA